VVTCDPGSLTSQNYRFVAGDAADVTIAQATVHVDANPAASTYGAGDPPVSSTLRAGDFVAGDTSSSSAITGAADCQVAGHSANAGTYTGVITCDAGSLAALNYKFLTGNPADLTVDQATMHVDAQPASTTYGAGDPTPVSGLRAADLVSGDTVASVNASGTASCQIANHSSNAGTYAGVITCAPGGLASQNYKFVAGSPADLTVDPAPLTVTADDRSKLFGAPVPALTATISGFVNGQNLATAGVSGSASCSTTATASSPGGSYPITCTQGDLSADNYAFTSYRPGTLTVAFATTITGTYTGKLAVKTGEPVLLSPGSSVNGPVTVKPGGTLEIDGATITGPLSASAPGAIRVCHARVTGPTTISAATGLVVLGDDDGSPTCAGSQLDGPVRITNGTGAVEFDENHVTGPLTITGNTGALLAPDSGPVHTAGNTIGGPINIHNP
jgi:hypothetical protein